MKILKLAVLALVFSLTSISQSFAHGSSVRIGINLGNPIVTHRYVPRYWGHYNPPHVYYAPPPVVYYPRPIRYHNYRYHYRDRGDRYFSRGDRRFYRQHRDRGYRGRFNGRANNNRRGWR